MSPTVLIVHSLSWPNAARLAVAFRELDCIVDALCHRTHPVRMLPSVRRIFAYNPFAPLRSFRVAIEQGQPDLIVPCDDWSVRLLHQLYNDDLRMANAPTRLQEAIRRSLGNPSEYALLAARCRLSEIAARAGIRLPRTDPVSSVARLEDWLEREGLPAVVKIDFSTGGEGVAIVATPPEAITAFARLERRTNLARALKRLLVGHDAEMAFNALRGIRPSISVQRFIPGDTANCAVACWNGELIAAIAVQVLASSTPAGQSTVLRVVNHEGMLTIARRVVGALGMSGFCGLDFIIEQGSGDAVLIEVNPRATQINHLALGRGRDLVAALTARVADRPLHERAAVTDRDTIALFPQEITRDPGSSFLMTAYHDVPSNEPALVRFYSSRSSRRGSQLEPAD